MNGCFKGKYKITSPYGNRILNGKPEFHKGVDLVGIDDKTVYAPCDGIIGTSTRVHVGATAEWGNYIRLDSADGKYSIFMCHLKSRAVVKGQKVTKGQKLGVMGSTGKSTGAHTHFEVRKYGTSTKENPADFIGIPNRDGTYTAVEKKMLESGNDIVWQLMNGNPKVVINEPKRAIEALDKAKDSSEFMSLYWIIYKVVNGNGD